MSMIDLYLLGFWFQKWSKWLERGAHNVTRIDQEVARLIRTLSVLARAEESEAIENPFCGNYFRMVFVLVAKPEKIKKDAYTTCKFHETLA